MTDWIEQAKKDYDRYYNSFVGISEEEHKNFEIKREHSYRVATLCKKIMSRLDEGEEDQAMSYVLGLFHDIGRYKQLREYKTFDDSKSVDHAELSVKVIRENDFLNGKGNDLTEQILVAIENHNKKELNKNIAGSDLLYAKVIRDADKLDILKVLTDYYSNPKMVPNHTLTWELPKGIEISSEIVSQVLKGKLVSKDFVKNQLDIKVMQLSWVYDLNFKPSFEILMSNHFLEKIFKTMPKNDTVIEIYRTVKVYAENKLLS